MIAVPERAGLVEQRLEAAEVLPIEAIDGADPEADACLAEIYGRTGRAYRIGVTGPPGAGKSTLIDALVGEPRQADRRVGVVAVDPTSPFTGGALLGDRVRVSARAPDPRTPGQGRGERMREMG